MKNKNNILYIKGSITLELLIAFTILTLNITAIMLIINGGQSISIDTETNQEAISKAENMIEEAKRNALDDFYSVVDKNEPSGGDIYTKNLEVTDINSYTKKITANIEWPAEAGRTLFTKITTFLTNPVVASGGDTCNPQLEGNWDNPQPWGSVDVGKDNGGTDVDVLARKAYVTADASSGNKPDFYIVDISNPKLPNLHILNGSGLETGPGLSAVHVAGDYAYVANMSTISQLQIIKTNCVDNNGDSIDDICNPEVVTSLDVTPPNPLDYTGVGKSIFYANKKIYLGLEKYDSGPEFYVIDVSNPTLPIVKATFETNTQVTSIVVKNKIAYLAVRYAIDGTSAEQLKILDVSNADTGVITQINTFSPNPVTMAGESLYISKDGKTLYLGEGGATTNKPVFFSLNTDTLIPSISKYIATKDDGKIGITIRALTIRDNLAFLWTNDPNASFQIWDLNDLNKQPVILKTQEKPTGGFDCDGNLLYTAQESNKALQIIGPGTNTPSMTFSIRDSSDNEISTANIGDKVHTKISLSGPTGTPTGKVDVTFYDNDNCSGTGTKDSGSPFTLDESGTVEQTSSMGPLNAGSYSFMASYKGDVNYDAINSSCKSLTIAKINPTISTKIYSDTTGLPVNTVVAGTKVHDEATVTGSATIKPTGSVSFDFYINKNNCLSGTPINAGSGLLSPSGVAVSVSTGALSKTSAGKYDYYVAHYSGDVNYNAINGACESLTVN